MFRVIIRVILQLPIEAFLVQILDLVLHHVLTEADFLLITEVETGIETDDHSIVLFNVKKPMNPSKFILNHPCLKTHGKISNHRKTSWIMIATQAAK